MPGTIAPFPLHQWLTSAGAVAASHRLFTYTAGTSTKVSVYTDSALSVAHSNPITLDSAGRPASPIFLTPGVSYKFTLAPSGSDDPPASTVWTVDNIDAVPVGSTAANADVTGTAGETLAAGDAVYCSDGSGGATAGRWYLADADNTYSSTLANKIGFSTEAISTGSSGAIRVSGRVTGLSGLTAGQVQYISATAGDLTTSAPTNARIVMIADSTTAGVIVEGHIVAGASSIGVVTSGAQTIAGAKTFSGALTASSTSTFSDVATFSVLPIGALGYSRCTSTLTKNNNTTLANVTGLAFTVLASANYYFRFVMIVNSTGTAGLKVALTGPAAPTGIFYGLQSAALKVTPQCTVAAFATDVRTGTGDIDETVTCEGFLRNGANAGTVQLQAAQDTADATDTTVTAESFVVYWRVS